MYSCTNNPLVLTFDMLIYTRKSQQAIIILHSIVFYGAYRFGKSMNLFLLIDLYNIFNDTKTIMFNLTIVSAQNKNIGECT